MDFMFRLLFTYLEKRPSKNPSKCKAFSLRSKIMPFKENLISLRATVTKIISRWQFTTTAQGI